MDIPVSENITWRRVPGDGCVVEVDRTVPPLFLQGDSTISLERPRSIAMLCWPEGPMGRVRFQSLCGTLYQGGYPVELRLIPESIRTEEDILGFLGTIPGEVLHPNDLTAIVANRCLVPLSWEHGCQNIYFPRLIFRQNGQLQMEFLRLEAEGEIRKGYTPLREIGLARGAIAYAVRP